MRISRSPWTSSVASAADEFRPACVENPGLADGYFNDPTAAVPRMEIAGAADPGKTAELPTRASVLLLMRACGKAKPARAMVWLPVCAVGVAAMVATAGARVPAHAPSRDAVVSGYVRVCGGPAPGGCRIETFGICEERKGCVTSHRIAAISASGQQVAVQRLRHARFRMRLAPGRYMLELLGGGSRVRITASFSEST